MDLNVYPAVGCRQFMQVVYNNDLFRDDVELEAHVFGIGHGCVEVKIGQVNPKKDHAWHADGGVNEKFGRGQVGGGRGFVAKFGRGQVGGGRGFVAGIVNAITANCEACAMLFFFLWAKTAANATVRGSFVQRDLCLSNEEAGVDSL